MAELEVDQSNLPRVQEVSQYFSVLEDGALAYNLQEQEIEQHYNSNVQRSQLVQKDIRVARRLQDEEQERAQTLHEHATRQLEEQDSEYARRIQEEIQRAAEEERKQEEKDEEIAKRIQEEEELYVRQRSNCRRTDGGENSRTISSPNRLQPSQLLFSEEDELAWHSRGHSPSPSTSDYEADHCESRRPSYRKSAENSEPRSQPVRELPLRRRSRQSRNSFASQSSTTSNLLGGWGDVVQLIKNDLSEQGYLSYSSEDELFEPIYKLERVLSKRQQASEQRSRQRTRLSRHSSMSEGSSRLSDGEPMGRVERYRRSDYKDGGSVRSEGRLVRHYSSSDSKSGDRQRRVRFQDDQRHNLFFDDCRAFEENHAGKRDLRSWAVRPYQGDVQLDRRSSVGERNRIYSHEGNGVRNSFSQEIREEEQDHGRFRERGKRQGGSCRVRVEHRPRAHSLREEWRREGRDNRRYLGEPNRRCVINERWQGNQEDRSSTEEEEMDRERERRKEETRVPRHPQRSLSVSYRGHSTGAGQRVNRPSLDLTELRQVLQDEELARRLQEEEEELLRGDLASASPLERSYPKGDFTVAQVAQDEEIAHFIQKQEIKAQLHSQGLEDCVSGRGCREISHEDDNSEVCDGQMPRERLNSEGLLSPCDEGSPEHQPPSPLTLAVQNHPFRNIAEELDPTFQRKGIVQAQQGNHATPQAGPIEDPAFVTPTKRQNDKPGRTKSKEKKENAKSKENCKQQ